MLEEPHKKIMNYDNSNTNLAAAQNAVEALKSVFNMLITQLNISPWFIHSSS